MIEHNHILINVLIFLELFLGVVIVLGLTYLSKTARDLERTIKERSGEIVERIVQVRQELATLQKYLKPVNNLKKIRNVRKIFATAADIIYLFLLLTPGSALRKVQKHITMKALKSFVSNVCT